MSSRSRCAPRCTGPNHRHSGPNALVPAGEASTRSVATCRGFTDLEVKWRDPDSNPGSYSGAALSPWPAQLARHYRDQEGLTIAEIARRLGRAEGTAKAYLYDPPGTWSCAAAVTSADWSPPPYARSSTPRATSRLASASEACSSASRPSRRRGAPACPLRLRPFGRVAAPHALRNPNPATKGGGHPHPGLSSHSEADELNPLHHLIRLDCGLWPQACWRRARPIARLRPSCASRRRRSNTAWRTSFRA